MDEMKHASERKKTRPPNPSETDAIILIERVENVKVAGRTVGS
jgi:hypothetical protein